MPSTETTSKGPFACLLTPFFNAIAPVKPFVLGAFGGVAATCIIQPVDIIKSRL